MAENKSLVGIVSELNQIETLIAEHGGELPPELEAAIEALNSEMAIKAGNYDKLIRHLEARAKGWNLEADRYYAVAKSLKSHAARLKDRIKHVMISNGIKEIVSQDVKFSISAGRPAVKVPDVNALPAKFKLVHYTADTDAIREAFNTEEVPGASMEAVYALNMRPHKGG